MEASPLPSNARFLSLITMAAGFVGSQVNSKRQGCGTKFHPSKGGPKCTTQVTRHKACCWPCSPLRYLHFYCCPRDLPFSAYRIRSLCLHAVMLGSVRNLPPVKSKMSVGTKGVYPFQQGDPFVVQHSRSGTGELESKGWVSDLLQSNS